MYNQEITKAVQDISKINFSGNIIPASWFSNITYKTKGNGPKKNKPGIIKTDLLAINILADVCYWYRATEVRDETTGKIVEYKKKFHADKLQKSYNDYSELFGQPKSSIKKSIDLLMELGLITREFRSITVKGVELHNVMYLEPVAAAIENITYTPHKEKAYLPKIFGTPPLNIPDTNTETNTQTTTQTTLPYKKEELKQDSKVGAMPPLESAINQEKPVSVKDQFRETGRFWNHFDQFETEDKALIGKVKMLKEISKDFKSDEDFEDLISTMHRKYDIVFTQEFWKAHVTKYPLEPRTKKQLLGGIEKWYSTRMLKMKEKEIEKESKKEEKKSKPAIVENVKTAVPIQLDKTSNDRDEEYENYAYKCTCGHPLRILMQYCSRCTAKLNWEVYKSNAA